LDKQQIRIPDGLPAAVLYIEKILPVMVFLPEQKIQKELRFFQYLL